MVYKITGNIVAVGPKGKHDLTQANAAVMGFLQKSLSFHGKYGSGKFTAEWDQHTTKYRPQYWNFNVTDNEHEIDTVKLNPIEVYDFPLDPFELDILKKDKLPSYLKRRRKAVIVRVSGHVPVLLDSKEGKGGFWTKHENEIVTIERVYREARDIYEVLKEKKDQIVPGRSLEFLVDNGHVLFTPRQFRGYITRNGNSPAFGVFGQLSEE